MNKTEMWYQTYNYLHDYYTNADYNRLINKAKAMLMPFPLDIFPRAVNLAQSSYYMKRKAKTAITRIFSKLNLPEQYLKRHLFTELVTFPDQSAISKNEVRKMNAELSKLRQKQKRDGISTLISSNEALLDKDEKINQHTHGLILTRDDTNSAKLSNYYTQWLNQHQTSTHQYKVIVKKFKVKRSTLKDSLKAFIDYVLKQYRLPILKNTYERQNYNKLPKLQRREFLHMLLHAYKSTRTAYILPTNSHLKLNWNELAKYISKDIIEMKQKKSGSQTGNHNLNLINASFVVVMPKRRFFTIGNIVIDGRSTGIPP